MTNTCIHGFAPDGCLICRTLSTGEGRTTQLAEQSPYRPLPSPARPDAVRAQAPRGHRRSFAGSLVLVLAALVAAGAAAWILVGLVFTVLHVLELVAVGAGCGWVGYKIGHFRGARHPNQPR